MTHAPGPPPKRRRAAQGGGSQEKALARRAEAGGQSETDFAGENWRTEFDYSIDLSPTEEQIGFHRTPMPSSLKESPLGVKFIFQNPPLSCLLSLAKRIPSQG